MYLQNAAQAVRQAERWILAAEQDKHPAIKLLHANYAVATVDMIRQLWSDRTIYSSLGKDMYTMFRQATALQDQAADTIRAQCSIIP